MLGYLLPLAAADDPMSHVKDFVVAGPITIHFIFVALAALLCIGVLPWVVGRILADGTGGRVGGFFESILLFIRDEVARPFLGDDTERFLPVLWTFFFFILFCNLVGLIPMSYTATSNINVTLGLAVVAFCVYHLVGIRQNGFLHYAKANLLVGPVFLWPLMIVIEAAGHIIRPFALAVRLFANMVAGHTMLSLLIGFTLILTSGASLLVGVPVTLAAVGGSVAIYILEIFIGFLQAFIFTFLTTVFLSLSLHPDH